MTFADRALGQVARLVTGAKRGATISLSHHFLAPVRIGDFVEMQPVISSVTARMVFVSGMAHVGDRSVVSAQGVFRIFHSGAVRS